MTQYCDVCYRKGQSLLIVGLLLDTAKRSGLRKTHQRQLHPGQQRCRDADTPPTNPASVHVSEITVGFNALITHVEEEVYYFYGSRSKGIRNAPTVEASEEERERERQFRWRKGEEVVKFGMESVKRSHFRLCNGVEWSKGWKKNRNERVL